MKTKARNPRGNIRGVVTLEQRQAWASQIADDETAWQSATGAHSPEALEAYRAGVQRGANAMIATLRLHNLITYLY